jgi:tetraacyldisaccharide 4'-kinase
MSRKPAERPFLAPLTPVYRLGVELRELRLRCGWEQVQRLAKPVVSIGNISAGGAGKTPLTIALAQALTRRGVAVDVLSRGYGRQSQLAARVDPEGTCEAFGDEPLLMARAAGVPVFVARQRVDAGRLAESFLLPPFPAENAEKDGAPETFYLEYLYQGTTSVVPQSAPDTHRALAPEGLALHLLDDGFQHRQLHRDVDIVLVSGGDLEDRLLPAGNLREPLRALGRATVVVLPAEEPETEAALRASGFAGPVWRVRRRMAVPVIAGSVIAFCGIARPEQFFAGLEQAGLDLVVRKAYADHHGYTAAELMELASAGVAACATLLTTEKDAVRLSGLLHLLPAAVELKTAGLWSEIVGEDAAVEWLVTRLS